MAAVAPTAARSASLHEFPIPRFPFAVALIAIAGCVSTPPVRQVLDKEAIEKVQGEIKREIGVYLAATEADSSAGQPEDFWCGKGDIEFDVSSVKAQLTTTVETADTSGIKAKIPFHAIVVGPSGSRKTDVTNTEELDYMLWPIALEQQPHLPVGDIGGAPIAKALLALRAALIDGAKKSAPGPQACFTDYSPDKPSADAGNSFKLGLSFVNDLTGGFEITVGVVDLAGTAEYKGTTGNTLTVAFVQRGLKEIQILKDEATKECAFPNLEVPLCGIATRALALVTSPDPQEEDRQLTEAVEELCKTNKATQTPGTDCRKAQAMQRLAEQRIGKGLGIR
jgi:hypothetical protein